MSDGPSTRSWATVGLVLLFVAGWVTLMFYYPPDRLVERLGVENAYLVLFFLSVLGALGSITTVSSYPAILTFATGGMNPFVLGIVSGLGLTLGDWVFFRLIGKVKGLLSGRVEQKAEKLGGWLEDRPDWVVQATVYLWVGLLPLANNILTGALALGGYRFRRILVALVLGNVTFPTLVAWLVRLGFDLS